MKKKEQYFVTGYKPATYIKRTNLEEDAEVNQLHQIRFDKQLQRCKTCSTKWHKSNSLDSWFVAYRIWLDQGNCSSARNGIDPFKKTVSQGVWKACGLQWMHDDPLVALYQFDIKLTKDKEDIIGWRQHFETIKMVN